MSSTYRILFLGDIMGRSGRRAVAEVVPSLLESYRPLFLIANGENAAGGVGITPDIANEFFGHGIDALTLGNHAFNKREIAPYLDSGKPIIRPANYPPRTPGKGSVTLEKDGVRLTVANLCGRVYMEGYDDPFRMIDEILSASTGHVFLDFHAEATSEKVAMGWHLDGRATAVVGTHTHVQTADERVLPGGTAYITDVGMCGPQDGVIGMDREIVLHKFRTSMPTRFEVSEGAGVVHGVCIDVDRESGLAESIERIRFSTQS